MDSKGASVLVLLSDSFHKSVHAYFTLASTLHLLRSAAMSLDPVGTARQGAAAIASFESAVAAGSDCRSNNRALSKDRRRSTEEVRCPP